MVPKRCTFFGRDQTILAHGSFDPGSVDGLLHLVKETVRQLGPPVRIATDASIEFQTIRFCDLLCDYGVEHVVERPFISSKNRSIEMLQD